jgi:hypothetical protein
MFKFITIASCIFFFSSPCFSQNNIWDLGGEYQYNYGRNISEHDLGVRYDGFQNKNNWNLNLSYDIGRSSSKNGKERESGYSLSLGYRYSFQTSANGNFFGGVRTTFEFDNWKGNGKSISKESVFVPKIETGYQFIYSTHGFTTPSVGYGYGIKLNAQGDETKGDEGSRFIPGISIGYRF